MSTSNNHRKYILFRNTTIFFLCTFVFCEYFTTLLYKKLSYIQWVDVLSGILLAIGLTIIYFLYELYAVKFFEFTIEENTIVVQKKIFRLKRKTYDLTKVTDAKYLQGFIKKAFNCVKVTLEFNTIQEKTYTLSLYLDPSAVELLNQKIRVKTIERAKVKGREFFNSKDLCKSLLYTLLNFILYFTIIFLVLCPIINSLAKVYYKNDILTLFGNKYSLLQGNLILMASIYGIIIATFALIYVFYCVVFFVKRGNMAIHRDENMISVIFGVFKQSAVLFNVNSITAVKVYQSFIYKLFKFNKLVIVRKNTENSNSYVNDLVLHLKNDKLEKILKEILPEYNFDRQVNNYTTKNIVCHLPFYAICLVLPIVCLSILLNVWFLITLILVGLLMFFTFRMRGVKIVEDKLIIKKGVISETYKIVPIVEIKDVSRVYNAVGRKIKYSNIEISLKNNIESINVGYYSDEFLCSLKEKIK